MLKKLRRKKVRPVKDEQNEVLMHVRKDRRLLSNVISPDINRSKLDRRGETLAKSGNNESKDYIEFKKAGIRYIAGLDVAVSCFKSSKRPFDKFKCKSIDISTTGILLRVKNKRNVAMLRKSKSVKLNFDVKPGSMPEGYEMKMNVNATFVRFEEKDGEYWCGFAFDEDLTQFVKKKKDRYFIAISSIFMLFITLFILMMRAESVIYFKYNKFLYLYSIVAAVFLLSRYFFGSLYETVPLDVKFTPGVSIIIPCFNEEKWIQQTILSCVNQDYPIDKIEVIVVDDCSNDKSVFRIKDIVRALYREEKYYKTKERIKCIFQPENKGKREALAEAAKIAKHDLLVFVDSDSFLDPFAIRHLVQPFKDPKMGGVAGRTDVANTYTNWLTKMQSVRYYIAFRIMKAAEGYFDAVTCLSGPLSCYKRSIVKDNLDNWLNQEFLGQRATFGDDRAMTNFVLKGHRTAYQDSAVCMTMVPKELKVFLKQQMRWKRSWLRESIIAARFMWRKEPFMAFAFYAGLIVPIAAPIVVLYNLIYVPILYSIFPKTFLLGILMMASLMSVAQMLLRKSTTWYYGVVFCLFYEAVLLWQMPIAWLTFWKSTWGTRLTPEDMKELEDKNERKRKRTKKKTGGAA